MRGARKEKAAALLKTRMQLPNENVTISTEEKNHLIRHADPDLCEEKKVRLLMRGVKQERFFAGLIRNSTKTVTEFISEISTIEKKLEMWTRKYNHSF